MITWLIFFQLFSLAIFIAAATNFEWPPEHLRNLATYILAYKGSGKSTLMSKMICVPDLLKGRPQIIIDGIGGLISAVLGEVSRMPQRVRREVLARLAYFDMSGKLTGHVPPSPVFYQLGQESVNTRAARYEDLVISQDSHMRNAPILGANQFLALSPINRILAASGWQLTEARLLLDHNPKLFKRHLEALKTQIDDWVLREDIEWYFSKFSSWDPKKKSQDTQMYRRKLDQLLRDDASVAMLGAADMGFLQATEQRGISPMLDFSGLQQDRELQRFMMNLWVDKALNFVKQRIEDLGPGLHLKPYGIVIDELAMLQNMDANSGNEVDPLTIKIGEILDQVGRQGMVHFCVANQELHQISPALFKTLMGAGIVVCGKTSDWAAADYLANHFMPPQPGRPKRYEANYRPDDTIRDYRQVDMSLDEQVKKAADLFMNGLGKFQFLVKEYGRPAPYLLDISEYEPGIYPDAERVRDLKMMLSEHWGTPTRDLLREINQRQQQIIGSGTIEIKTKPQIQRQSQAENEARQTHLEPASPQTRKQNREISRKTPVKESKQYVTVAVNGQSDEPSDNLLAEIHGNGAEDLDELFIKTEAKDRR
jgi:hypothetical protein